MLSGRETTLSQHGFSLLSLMITIAIVGILASIAYPSYRATVLRVNRMEATAALSDVASKMTRQYVVNMTYTNDLVALGLGTNPYITESGNYSIRVRDNGGGGGACPIAICYQLEATPIGAQADDTDCSLFQLNSSGDQVAHDDNGDQNNSCW